MRFNCHRYLLTGCMAFILVIMLTIRPAEKKTQTRFSRSVKSQAEVQVPDPSEEIQPIQDINDTMHNQPITDQKTYEMKDLVTDQEVDTLPNTSESVRDILDSLRRPVTVEYIYDAMQKQAVTIQEISDALQRQSLMMQKIYDTLQRQSVPVQETYDIRQSVIVQDNSTLQRRIKVKEMMRHAWNNYKLFAWGRSELRPIAKEANLNTIFGTDDVGTTIVDSLDTLYLMGMIDEFREGRNWVAAHLNIKKVDSYLPMFETTVRFVGGLLSCFALTGDSVFKDKAVEVADALLPAFDTPTGLPHALINPSTKQGKCYHWSGSRGVLSEVGGLHMEFTYLSEITGFEVYKKKVDRIRSILSTIEKPDNLYPSFIGVRTGEGGQRYETLGEYGDSFYEYLLKAWLVSGQTDDQARIMFDTAMQALLDKTLRVSPGGLSYLTVLKYGRIFEERMDHLSCFAGGMFALASTTLKNELSERYMDVAKKLTHTCHESYVRSDTKLGPEAFWFSGAIEARTPKMYEQAYRLRPETVESYFILWRLTKDQKYRDWGWEVVQAMEEYCREDGGYTGLMTVYAKTPRKDDEQPSYFLAETLKYLYLLFSDDSLISLDDWVFNTKAHPFPVKGKNPLYRA